MIPYGVNVIINWAKVSSAEGWGYSHLKFGLQIAKYFSIPMFVVTFLGLYFAVKKNKLIGIFFIFVILCQQDPCSVPRMQALDNTFDLHAAVQPDIIIFNGGFRKGKVYPRLWSSLGYVQPDLRPRLRDVAASIRSIIQDRGIHEYRTRLLIAIIEGPEKRGCRQKD